MMTWVDNRGVVRSALWGDPDEARQQLLALSLEMDATQVQALRADFADFWRPIAEVSLRVRGVLYGSPHEAPTHHAGPGEADLLSNAVLSTWADDAHEVADGELWRCCVTAHLRRWSELLPVTQADVAREQLDAHLLCFLAGLAAAGDATGADTTAPLCWFVARAAEQPELPELLHWNDGRYDRLHESQQPSNHSRELSRVLVSPDPAAPVAPGGSPLRTGAAVPMVSPLNLTLLTGVGASMLQGAVVASVGGVGLGVLSAGALIYYAEKEMGAAGVQDRAVALPDPERPASGPLLSETPRSLPAVPLRASVRPARVVLARSVALAQSRPEPSLPREFPEASAALPRPLALALPQEGGGARGVRRLEGGGLPRESEAGPGVRRPGGTGSLPSEGTAETRPVERPQGRLLLARRGSARAYFRLPSGLVDSALGRLGHTGQNDCRVAIADGRVVRVQIDDGDLKLSERRGLDAATAFAAVVAVLNGSCEEGGR